jgi:hypothetical protein
MTKCRIFNIVHRTTKCRLLKILVTAYVLSTSKLSIF